MGREWRNEVHKSFARSASVYGVFSPGSVRADSMLLQTELLLLCYFVRLTASAAVVLLSCCMHALQSFECLVCCQEKSVELEHDKCTVHLALLKLFCPTVLTQFAEFFPFLEFLKTWIQYSCFSKDRLSVWSLVYHHKCIIHSCRSDSSLTWYRKWA